MDPAAAKQQIAERVKQGSRFLVTVNANPTVDELAACIGLTIMLNKMGKHATAVFSGEVPSTIEFLQPEKTLETNADSLRDFIISLDKNKADKLRYKVEDDVVRIFITPYRTSLSEKDFVFSEGDFNVEVVMALGVTQRAQLDQAISAHGRILHDATVISINASANQSDLGQINWQDSQASSLSEMLVSISEAFGPGLIDSQIATAFLTGIVAETGRFSNKKTSPKVMTMSAQLMAAGANQQLIVSKLEPPPPPPPKTPPPPPPSKPRQPQKPKLPSPKLKPEGVINVPKGDGGKEKTDIELGTTEIHIDEQGNLHTLEDQRRADEQRRKDESEEQETESASEYPEEPVAAPEPEIVRAAGPPLPETESERAEEESPPRSPHAFMGSTAQPDWAAPYDLVPDDPMSNGGRPEPGSVSVNAEPSSPSDAMSDDNTEQPLNVPTPVSSSVDSARNAVQSALAGAPFDPAFSQPVQSLNAQPATPALHDEAPTPAAAAPNDTPSLVLPTSGEGPVSATPPPELSQTAPPPVPPPLMTAQGAIIPNPSQDSAS